MSGNGMHTSLTANAVSQPRWRRSPRRAPVRAAIGSSTAAPSATRDQATKMGGTPSSTAILMNRYGMPQIRDIAANSPHARADMRREDTSAAAARQLPGQRQQAGGRGGLDEVAR